MPAARIKGQTTRVRSFSAFVRAANPDFDLERRKEPAWEFEGGRVKRTFYQDIRKFGPYVPVLAEALKLPVLSGVPEVNSVLTCTTGTWDGTSPISYTYQWQRDNTLTAAAGNSYTLLDADIGAMMSCVVTAKNPAGTTQATSNTVGPVLAPPLNIEAPVVSGEPVVNAVLSVTHGEWTYTPISYAYQWQRDGADISGATASTYMLVTADIGAMLSCVVTASNADGSTDATSNEAGPVIAAHAPVNSVAPLVTGGSTVGSMLSVTNGTWLGVPTGYTYLWKRGSAFIFPEAATNSYMLQPADLGALISCVVTATNAEGQTAAASNNIGAVVEATTPVGGAGLLGAEAYGFAADFTHPTDPLRVIVKKEIGGAYLLINEAVGFAADFTYPDDTQRVAIKTITIVPPVNTVAPAASGTAMVGSLLSVTPGTWSSAAPLTYAYRWKRDGADIPAATADSYALTVADIGATMTCRVTTTNSAGSTAVLSNSLGPVIALPAPVNTVAPVVSGTPQVELTLSVTNGTWNYGPTGYVYQWLRGSTPVGTSTNTYTLALDDLGAMMSCRVAATNASGTSSPTTSNSLGPVAPAAPVGGAALLLSETEGFAVDFTYPDDSHRVAVKTP